MISEYFDAFQTRVEIYKKWDLELNSFLTEKNYRKYEESLAEATLSLRAIREVIKNSIFPSEFSENIRNLEALEDQHLRLKVEFHSKKIQGQDVSNADILRIESEIMEFIQEILSANG
jgi:phosphoenolpyruvate synthase/pyruvate phosphate dikinase